MEHAVGQLCSLTNHPHVILTHRGDGAIFVALHIVKFCTEKRTILIPDQAGWWSFKTLPPLFGFEVVEVKTDYGRIDLADLETKTRSEKPAALLIQSLAGYFIQQPMEDIIKICRKNNCLVIEDVSGSIGFLPVYDSDIKVCSFGRDKLLNVGTGGFVSTKEDVVEQWKNQLEPVLRLCKPSIDTALLIKKIDSLKARITFLSEKAQKIKSDLAHLQILHRTSPSVNVVIMSANDAEKKEIVSYCVKHQVEYTFGPRYIRVECPAVSIEVKRL